MKKILKALLYIIGIIVILVGVAAAFISLRGIPSYTPEKKDITVEVTPARVQEGARLASMLCKHCHYSEQTQKFTGREMKEAPQFGLIYSRNITRDHSFGIGSWTDGELVYFLRTGIKRDGKYAPPYMPKLIHISDEDLYSIIAFLRSDNPWVQPDNTRMPDTKPSFLTKFLITIGAAKPFPYPDKKIEGPDTTDKVKWGRYIALYQLECYACHSRDFAKNDYFTPENSPGFFAGGNKMYDESGKNEMYTLNITMDDTGIGSWSEDEFVQAVRFGKLPNNQHSLRYPMIAYANLSDMEAKAIYAYLKTVPKVKNKVERRFYE